MLNTSCPEESDVDSSSGESTVSDKLYALWLFEAQDNEIIDKLHILHSAQKKGMMRQLLLTACFWATVWLIPAVHGRLSLDTPTRALLGPWISEKEGVEMLVQGIVECKGGISDKLEQ